MKLKILHGQTIAVFIESKKGINENFFIDNVHISSILQELEEITRFTSHSIRVGACVLLHGQNQSSEDIKFRLRWRSDSFRMYLRNIIQLAERHRDAIRNAQ